MAVTERNELILIDDPCLYLLSLDTGELRNIVDLGGESVLGFRQMNDRYLLYDHSTNALWGDSFLHLYDFEAGTDKILHETELVDWFPSAEFHEGIVYYDAMTGNDGTFILYDLYSYDIETEKTQKVGSGGRPLIYDGGICQY